MTTSTYPNPVKGVAKILRDDTDVSTLASTRVYAFELASTEVDNMPRHSVVVTPVAGGPLGPGASSYIPFGITRLNIFCYGATAEEAFQLYVSVNSAMKALTRSIAESTVIYGAEFGDGPVSSRDEDEDWPYTLGVYDVSAAEEPSS